MSYQFYEILFAFWPERLKVLCKMQDITKAILSAPRSVKAMSYQLKKLILTTIATLGLCLSSWAANLAWTPVTSATWDLVITNWVDTNSLLSVAFAQRDNVLFDSTGLTQPSVALGNNVLSPNSVVVEVDSPNQYSLATAGTGKLTNVFSLTKRGSGTLILDADDVITNAISGR
jgi:hypothetical protein